MKTYVIDTNVLVHDYHAFDNILQGNKVVIPYQVLQELDNLKSKTNTVGVNARHAIRRIEAELIAKTQNLLVDMESYPNIKEPDDRILELCLCLVSPILISKDVCLRTKARVKGVQAEDYREDKVQVSDLYSGLATEYITSEDLDTVYKVGKCSASESHYPNQAVVLIDYLNQKNKCLTIHKNGILHAIDNKVQPFGLNPANMEQHLAVNLLLDKDIPLISMTGRAGCYPKGTEFFTGKGWKAIEEYEPGDLVMQVDPETLEGSLTQPEYFIKEPVDQFYNIKNRRINFTTSKYHKHLTLNLKTKTYQTKTTEELLEVHNRNRKGNNRKLITSFKYFGKGIPFTDNQIRIKIAIMADGYINPETNRVQMSFKKERKIERFRTLLIDNNIPYTEGLVSGYTRFWFKVDLYEKEFQNYWYEASEHQLNVICEEVLMWDGSVVDREGRKSVKAFHSTSKKSADFIQYVFTVTGKNPTVYRDIREERKTCFSIYQNNSTGLGIIKSPRAASTTEIVEVPSEDGFMYCFTVPTGFFVVKQNDQIFVSGNSGKTLLAVACALEAVLERNEYSKITIARPVMPFQGDIGFLP